MLTCGALLLLITSWGQDIRGNLSGTVLDAESGRPVADVQVKASAGADSFGQVSDSLGRFFISGLPVGIYRVEFRSLSHGVVVFDEVWVRAGKTQELHAQMSLQAFDLPSFEVGTERVRLERMDVRSFTVEQSLRYAATFSDPARLVNTYPGVAVSNDQANHFSVRGNTPNATKWFIQTRGIGESGCIA